MNETESTPALEVQGVTHSFGKRKALDGVSLTIDRGQFTVLLGQNGAGKTTLFSLVTRLYDNRSGGSIRVFGFDVRERSSEALARIGVVFQQRTLDLDLTVRQNLLYHAALHGLASAEVKQRAEEELARLGLSERSGDKVRQLSGGQLRRVEIARALLHRPRLLLLDEPTVGLDIGSRQDILDHVRKLVREEDLGLLWATHLDRRGCARTTRSWSCTKARSRARGERDGLLGETGASDLREAFQRLTKEFAPSMTAMARTAIFAASMACIWREALRFLHQRERFMAALVRPLVWLFIFAAGFRSVLGRVDHSALRDLRALRGLHHPWLGRHDPAVQRHAELALHGLRPGDGQHAHALGQPHAALVSPDLPSSWPASPCRSCRSTCS